MFILKIIKTVPILLVINVYASKTDSSLIYYNLGLEKIIENKYEISGIYFKKAIDFSKDSGFIAKSLIYIGFISSQQGIYKNAYDFYSKAQTFTKDPELLSKIYSNQGIIKRNIGDYKKAILLYQKALDVTNDEKQKARIYNNLANTWYEQNNYNYALDYYLKSYAIKRTIDRKSLPFVYLNIALCYQALELSDKADEYYKITIKETIKLYGEENYILIKTYSNYGNFLINSNPEKSLHFLSKAIKLALLNFGNKHPEIAKTYKYIGLYYDSLREYKKALEYYQKALVSNSTQFNNTDFYKNPSDTLANSKLTQLEILHQKAIVLKKYANISNDKQKLLEMSLKTYELAIETLFKLRNSFMDESKRILISNRKDMFAEAAYVAIKLKDDQKAFQLIEKGKAFTLLAAINNNEAIRYSDIPDSLINLENEFKRLQFVYTAKKDADSLLWVQAKYDSLIGYFEKHYSKYHGLKYGKTDVDPCNFLDSNQVLLQYAITDTFCITLMVSKNNCEHHIFSIDDKFRQNLQDYIGVLKKYDMESGYKKQHIKYTKSAYYLWKKLIEPLKIPYGKSLIIIPDKKLSYVAFEALLETEADTIYRHYYNLNYLVYKHPISYGYSTQWLFEPYLGNPSRNIGAFALDYKDHPDYMPLKSSVSIAKKLTRFLKGKSYINEKCTKKIFIDKASKYKILHLSMHGETDPENDMNSQLIFYDQKLKTWEIYGMQLNARLAYLRSCSTGDGTLVKGEGIFSIGRAFAYAGCPTLISSLWDEGDYSSIVTQDFYKYMNKGYSLDVAMQKAKINYLKNKLTAYPSDWANKIIMGKTYPVKQKTNYLYFVIGILCIGIIYKLLIRFIK